MQNILVLGNGLVSSAIAIELSRYPATKVRVVARNHRQSDEVLKRFGVAIDIYRHEDFWTTVEESASLADALFSAIGVASPALFEENGERFRQETDKLIDRFSHLARSSEPIPINLVTSGGTIYGETSITGAKETDSLLPISRYGQLNAHFENQLKALSTGVSPFKFFRVANLYGLSRANQRSRSFVDAAVEASRGSREIKIFGDGSHVRDFIHVSDAARQIAQLGLDELELASVNIGTGIGTSLDQVVAIIEKYSEVELKRVFLPPRQFDVNCSVLDSDYAAQKSQVRPRLLDDGVAMERAVIT